MVSWPNNKENITGGTSLIKADLLIIVREEKMERKEILVLVVVVLLAVTAVIQTVQLVRLGDAPITIGSAASSSAPLGAGSSDKSSSSATSLDSLPSMVGGC